MGLPHVRAEVFQPYIKTEGEVLKEANGATIEKVSRCIYLDNCSLRLVTHNAPGENKLHIKKWGDFFFGLSLGAKWNEWSFLSVSVQTKDGRVSPMSNFKPSSLCMVERDQGSQAEFIWPLSADAGSGTLRLSVCQFAAHRDWLFFRIEVKPPAELKAVSFMCYPSDSSWPPQCPTRERMAASKENLYNVSKDKFEFIPQSPGLIYYNKYYGKNEGCMALLDRHCIEKIALPKTTNAISTNIVLKSEVSSFSFALGCFTNTPAENAATMFLGESQDIVYAFLNDIDWNPRLDENKIHLLSGSIGKILDDASGPMGLPVDKSVIFQESDPLVAEAAAAIRRGDLSAYSEARRKLEVLKKSMIDKILANYK